MTAYERLDLLFQQNNGIVKTAQVLEIGIAKSTFYAYAKQRGVEQAAHGVYVSPDAWTDAMYLLHLTCTRRFQKSAHTVWLSLTIGQRSRFPLISARC